ncbi:DeoR/GlpR family DNA-binding transcription regulator [Curtobacterium sp. 9128]|uniref:DeoR/GlpR family DNA-binding transcription regulator n=1 Tax=Curtobacterium sp. 9128 TaxID=1793722 RepID=UPI001642756B|nr:DeoR/GlpR family DNA-binding transcription regulator [Curtobacterium sp. 9128]
MRYTEAPARRLELLRRLESDGYVASAVAAEEFGVSEMTIRRDLRQLDLEGLARRVVGGASRTLSGEAFEDRDASATVAKQSIAELAADVLLRLTGPEPVVALDAGTTVAPIVAFLPAGTTVVSHSAPVIAAAIERGDLPVVALGGEYHPRTRAFGGSATRAALETLALDVAVLSATAVTPAGVLCAVDVDADVKRAMAAGAERCVLLADHAKFAARAPIRVGPLDLVDVLVTDADATDDQVGPLRAAGLEVLRAPASGAPA